MPASAQEGEGKRGQEGEGKGVEGVREVVQCTGEDSEVVRSSAARIERSSSDSPSPSSLCFSSPSLLLVVGGEEGSVCIMRVNVSAKEAGVRRDGIAALVLVRVVV